MKIKKLIIICILFLCVTLLIGCGKNGTSGVTEGNNVPQDDGNKDKEKSNDENADKASESQNNEDSDKSSNVESIDDYMKENAQDDYQRTYGNSVNNFYKNLQVAMYKDRIYYSEYNSHQLCSIKKDGKDYKELNTEDVYFINVYKDKIYYIHKIDDDNSELIKVDLDGKNNREVIAKNPISLLIKNNKLIYGIRGNKINEGEGIGYRKVSFVRINLQNNETETNEVIGYGTVNVIDENMYKGYSTSVGNYITDFIHISEENKGMIFPVNQNEYNTNINLKGITDNFIIAQLNDITKSNSPKFKNQTVMINKNGKDYKKILDLKDDIKASVSYGENFYYYKDNNFYCYDIKQNKNEMLFNNKYTPDNLFEFNGIIYEAGGAPITPIYDCNKEKVIQ